MPNIKLYIGSELADFNEAFNVMFSIGDIRNVGFGNNNKTYTLNLPLTKQNKKLISFISQPDVKSETDKTGRLYLGEWLVIQGKVIVLNPNQNDNYASIVINSDDWIDLLSNKKLSDLDLSASDHTLDHTTVESSWSASYPFYRYPMINFGALSLGGIGGNAKWLPNDFIPMFSVCQLIEKILSPYTISSVFLGLAAIKDLFILANEKIANDEFIIKKNLDVSPQVVDNQIQETINIGATLTVNLVLAKIRFNTITIDEAGGMGAGYEYTIPEAGTYRFTASILMQNSFMTVGEDMIRNSEAITLTINRQRGVTVTVLDEIIFTSSATNRLNAVTYALDSEYYHCEIGDTIYISLTAMSNMTNNTGIAQTREIYVDESSKLINVWNKANLYSGVTKTIECDKILPDMTQLDFLAAIRDIFNLRFFMDKVHRTIYIEPWDQFLSDTIVDLTDYIDFESIETELISKNYNKSIVLKWKDDTGDEAFTEYLKTNSSPGKKTVTLNSLYTNSGEQIKEHPFSSILTGYNASTYYGISNDIPRIFAEAMSLTVFPTIFNRKVGFNTRIVKWDGLTSGSWNYDGDAKTTYPQIEAVSWVDLYNSYWMRFFHWIDKGKLFTIRMKDRPGFLNQFISVLNSQSDEGFSPTYQILINVIKNYFAIQKVTSDGQKIECEMFLKQ
jgi:hypothetical protein